MLRLGMLRLGVLWRRLWLGYSREDLVLDVGSGHRPHPRSDVLCDRHLRDDRERLGPLVMDRPLVVGDLTALPFRDRCVDFLICQHVLEHVDDPAKALDEMMRVARAGYIETPAPLWERLVGRPYHHWLVSKQGSRIICSAKPDGVPDPDLLAAFERFARSGSAWAELTLEQFDHFYTAYLWRDRIEYEIRGFAGSETKPAHSLQSPEEGEVSAAFARRDAGHGRVKALALKLLRILLASPRRIDLESIIACPSCHGTLARVGDGYQCVSCRLRYPIREGVPVLLLSEATSIASPAAGENGNRPQRTERRVQDEPARA
jgi:uncharacterized protein YbaR (Trm112 family)/SAM-dependent methyltransferase